jgi:hypothetical protein
MNLYFKATNQMEKYIETSGVKANIDLELKP